MAEEEKKPAEGAETDEVPSKKGKKGVLLGGGIVGLVATAYVMSLVAVPKPPVDMPFLGPFIAGLAQSQDRVQVNLADAGGKRFLVMSLKAEYYAYDEAYALTRVADPLYQAKEKDALIKVSRQKSKADLDDDLGEDVFKQEVRDVIDPILFPVHLGDEVDANLGHADSGLRPGRSNHRATMRGGYKGHRIAVDATQKTVQLDAGPVVTFEGQETDLMIENEAGLSVYVDVSGLDPEFVGEVQVGTFGRVQGIYFDSFLVQ